MSPSRVRIEYMKLADLERAPRNPKEHDLGAIHQSINKRGFVMPILVDERTGRIVAGHGRLDALLQKEKAGETAPNQIEVDKNGAWLVPVVRGVGFKTDAEAEAYLLADNQTTLLGGWNVPMLAESLKALEKAKLLEGTGFDQADLDDLVDQITGADKGADAVPGKPAKGIARRGDIWILGEHRILCGDSTKPRDVARILGRIRPAVMVTDPPYGVELAAGWRISRGMNTKKQKNQVDRLKGDDRADWSEAYKLSRAPVAYVWHGDLRAIEIGLSVVAAGYDIRQQIVWLKTSGMTPSRGAYHPRHEAAWYAVRRGMKASWRGGRKESTVWEADAPRQSRGKGEEEKADHPTQKPALLFERAIRNHTATGQVVYDPFCGSGTAIVAAEQTGRKALAVEIEPKYVDVAVARWEKLTGKKARKA